MIETRLLLAADDLCRPTGGRPRDAFMRRAFRSPEATVLGSEVSRIGLAFVELQQERHRADYDPSGIGYMVDETRAAVAKAREAIALLSALEPDARRTLATLLLFKARDRNDR